MTRTPFRDIRRFFLAALLFWTLLIALSWWWNLYQGKKSLMEMAVNQAVLSLDKDLVYRRWAALHGGVYVPITQQTPANPYLQHVPERDITTPSGRQLTLVNPAYMTRQVFEVGKESYGARGHITSLTPLRPENRPDTWEQGVLQQFKQGTLTELHGVEQLEGKPYLRYMRAMITEQGCLKCHAHQGYRLGDIRGGISVSVPLTSFLEQGSKQHATIAIGHTVIWLIGIGFMLLVRQRLAAGMERELESASRADELQTHLFQQEKMASIGQLAAGVAHEINNPMGFITSNLGTLQKYVERLVSYTSVMNEALAHSTTAEQRTTLDENRRKLKIDHILTDVQLLVSESLEGADRVKYIVNDLKSFARADQNLLQPLQINTCITTALNLVRNEYKYCAELQLELQEELPELNGNSQQLVQVVSNLVVNAAHAISEQGSIKVRSWQQESTVCFSVSDTGHGIPDEVRSRIFEPFFTTKEAGKGTGLGLSISYNIIKKHGGEITVESEVSRGTVFTVCLPVTQVGQAVLQPEDGV
jgi:two-component system NtrC family sensor kinase